MGLTAYIVLALASIAVVALLGWILLRFQSSALDSVDRMNTLSNNVFAVLARHNESLKERCVMLEEQQAELWETVKQSLNAEYAKFRAGLEIEQAERELERDRYRAERARANLTGPASPSNGMTRPAEIDEITVPSSLED